MKKFKDFLYDKNDILIAVLILVVAASIIAWRMDVILQYPKQLIHNDKQIETPTVDPSKTDDTSKGCLLYTSGMGSKLCMSPDSGILAVPRLPKASCKYAPQ